MCEPYEFQHFQKVKTNPAIPKNGIRYATHGRLASAVTPVATGAEAVGAVPVEVL